MIEPSPVLSPVQALKTQLRQHALYAEITDTASLHGFMRHHVFCVWDFMSLLKSLQQELTCVSLPWRPAPHPAFARLINEIVLDEETDLTADGRVMSHFEWYLEAMAEAGLPPVEMQAFLQALADGQSADAALNLPEVPAAARDFTRTTMAVLQEPLAVRASVFFNAREDVIPAMFLEMVRNLDTQQQLNGGKLIAYLQRHIELDGEEHGPRARQLLDDLLGSDPAMAERAEAWSLRALQARLDLWDAITEQIRA